MAGKRTHAGADAEAAPAAGHGAPLLCRDCVRLDLGGGAVCPDCGSSRVLIHPELASLDIAHIDCDAFYASVEKRDDPSIRDQPLIVGHRGGRGVVTTACYIARRFGIRSAMPMFRARELCPHAVIIEPDMAKYKAVSRAIRAIFADISHTFEPVSLDEAYLDLTAPERVRDEHPALALADIAGRIEREVGITVSIGLSYNKFLAKLASELEKPRGFSAIGRAEAKAFLADLPVRKVHGVGEATARRMEALALVTVGDLQRLSARELQAHFGKFGARLADFVQGLDPRRVTADRETKSVSAETTFARDTGRAVDLIAAVGPLCERVAERLVRAGLSGRTVVLKLKTSDFRTLTRNSQLREPTQRADVLKERAASLILREAGETGYRLIGIGVADIADAHAADPPDLFSELPREQEQ